MYGGMLGNYARYIIIIAPIKCGFLKKIKRKASRIDLRAKYGLQSENETKMRLKDRS